MKEISSARRLIPINIPAYYSFDSQYIEFCRFKLLGSFDTNLKLTDNSRIFASTAFRWSKFLFVECIGLFWIIYTLMCIERPRQDCWFYVVNDVEKYFFCSHIIKLKERRNCKIPEKFDFFEMFAKKRQIFLVISYVAENPSFYL